MAEHNTEGRTTKTMMMSMLHTPTCQQTTFSVQTVATKESFKKVVPNLTLEYMKDFIT